MDARISLARLMVILARLAYNSARSGNLGAALARSEGKAVV
jgi:hypothetical protein